MADSNTLRQHVFSLRQSFLDEGMLDEYFIQLEELEEENPHFAEEVMTIFLRDSTKVIATVEHALDARHVDLSQIDQYLHQLKGSSSSVGAQKVYSENNEVRALLNESEIGRVKAQFSELKNEHEKLKSLVPYFQMLRQLDDPLDTPQRK